jgi:hypothetical protein
MGADQLQDQLYLQHHEMPMFLSMADPLLLNTPKVAGRQVGRL